MQNVENDMDDFFRKAVDNYTLQAGEDNWNTIVSQLTEEHAATTVNSTHKKNNTSAIILSLMLLFIPLSTAMFSFYYKQGIAAKEERIATTTTIQDINNQQKKSAYKPVVDKQNSLTFTTALPVKAITTQRSLFNAKASKITSAAGSATMPANYILDTKQDDSVSSAVVPNALTATDETVAGDEQKRGDKALQSITPKPKDVQQRRLHAGLMAGIAFNEVKNQGFKKAGFDAGIIAGYRLNKKVAVEAGLLYSKKYYFSDGRYFSMDKMSGSMPAAMKILSLEGSSNLYQLPIAVKYTIAPAKQSTFFSSAGISSYILTKEKNNYETAMDGVEQKMQGMYKHVSAGFASSVDISIGYQHTLQNTATISIQPYLQIPLKGIGMGSMQVGSTGIRIAYTK